MYPTMLYVPGNKDRSNAQARSCVGHFIDSHIDPNYKGDLVHDVEMAGSDGKNE